MAFAPLWLIDSILNTHTPLPTTQQGIQAANHGGNPSSAYPSSAPWVEMSRSDRLLRQERSVVSVAVGIGEPWPGGHESAVSLTFDDGLRSHLDIVSPLLDTHDFQATFYLTPRGGEPWWRERLKPWRAVARAGHEIGNHSLTHPCSENYPGILRGVESWTLRDAEKDLLEAEHRLREGIPDYDGPRTFGYPCYQEHVGSGPNRKSCVPLVARHFVAGRGKGETANHPESVDLHFIWSWGVERCSGPELIGLCEWAAMEGRWAVLTFHGINEGTHPVAETDLRLLVAHLARHRNRIWTAPLATVAARVSAWRGASRQTKL